MTQNKYNKGDQVQIANGDWFELDVVYTEGDYDGMCDVYKDGHGYTVDKNLITDHRPAFDWGSVKSGECFKDHKGRSLFFIGLDPCSKHNAWLKVKIDGVMKPVLKPTYTGDLTRHPEGNIKEEV